jgi:hypothetical protein
MGMKRSLGSLHSLDAKECTDVSNAINGRHIHKEAQASPLFSVLLMAVVFVTAAAFAFTTGAHAAASESRVPMSPSGFKTPANADLSQLVGKDLSVHVETLTLPAASCSAKELARSGGKCQILHYWKTGTSSPPFREERRQPRPRAHIGTGGRCWIRYVQFTGAGIGVLP